MITSRALGLLLLPNAKAAPMRSPRMTLKKKGPPKSWAGRTAAGTGLWRGTALPGERQQQLSSAPRRYWATQDAPAHPPPRPQQLCGTPSGTFPVQTGQQEAFPSRMETTQGRRTGQGSRSPKSTKEHTGRLTRNVPKDHVGTSLSSFGKINVIDKPPERMHRHLSKRLRLCAVWDSRWSSEGTRAHGRRTNVWPGGLLHRWAGPWPRPPTRRFSPARRTPPPPPRWCRSPWQCRRRSWSPWAHRSLCVVVLPPTSLPRHQPLQLQLHLDKQGCWSSAPVTHVSPYSLLSLFQPMEDP